MNESGPRLSVVVGTRNRRAQIQRCLESILAQTRVPLRVYVADAGSTDGTLEYLTSVASAHVVPVLSDKPLGQARAYNSVFAQIETPYTCWISDDNVVVDRSLDLVVAILDDQPAIGMVALKVKDVTGPFVGASYIGGVSSIGILNVNQGVVRTPILKSVGGFSEFFRDYGIDPDLTAKVLFSGHRIVYTRQIALLHHRNWAADLSSPEYAEQLRKQQIYLRLFDEKYARWARGSLMWTAKKLLWRWLRRTLGHALSLDSPQPIMGLLPRDWYNILASRYVSVWDPWICRAKPYYLMQVCPQVIRPSRLPPDPVVVEAF